MSQQSTVSEIAPSAEVGIANDELFDKVRAASLAALDAYSESDFDKPAPESFREFCPTMGDVFTLIATHPMMHAGQFVVVRRQLGKPILM